MTVQSRPDDDRLLEWWRLARYEPDAVDPDRLAETLPEELDGVGASADVSTPTGSLPWTRAQLAAGILACLAEHDPWRLAGRLDDLLGSLDEEPVADQFARTLGTVATVDDVLFDTLVASVPDGPARRLENAVTVLERTADRDPGRVEPAVDDLTWAYARAFRVDHTGVLGTIRYLAGLGGDDLSVRQADSVTASVARTLGAVAATDEDTRDRARELLDDADPARRACGARALGAAAGRGAEPCLYDVPDLAGTVVEDDDPEVRVAALTGLGAAAGTFPGAVAEEIDDLLDCADDLATTGVESAFEGICRGDPDAFEAVLDWVVDAARKRADLYWLADRRLEQVGPAIVAGADEHPGVFGRHERAVETVLDLDATVGVRAVERGARWRPELYGDAADTLLGWIESYPAGVDVSAVHRTVAALAPVHPVVGDRLVERTLWNAPDRQYDADEYRRRDPYAPGWQNDQLTGPRFRAAARVCAAVAEHAPGALLSVPASTPDWDLVEVFRHLLDGPGLSSGVTLTLARLGRYDPAVVRPVADVVAWRLPEALGRTRTDDYVYSRGPDRSVDPGVAQGLFELGGVALRADPGAVEPVVEDVLDGLWDAPDKTEYAVRFLADLCVGLPEYVPDVAEMVDSPVRASALSAIAAAARDRPEELLPFVEDLVAASSGSRTEDQAEAATEALATIAAGLGDLDDATRDERDGIRERLRTLVYEPQPSVRRWAAFGLGELAGDDAGGAASLERVRRVAQRGDDPAAGAAHLALVRAGRRPAAETVEALTTVAVECRRPMADVALSELLEVGGDDATAAVDRVRATATDPVVRRRAREATEGR